MLKYAFTTPENPEAQRGAQTKVGGQNWDFVCHHLYFVRFSTVNTDPNPSFAGEGKW